jgi:eukaryotic-like serine/threonine-protein kinase
VFDMNRTAIGPYRVTRLLGRGGMAEVHLAIAPGASGFEREVAIKTILPDLADEPELERALIREAVIGGALHHRNLVSVLGLGVADGHYYVVLEYVDRGDLARHLDRRPMPEPLALHVVSEVARGLAHLHAARDARGLPLGIVHRDVAPANVLVSSTGDVKLADFGIAKATALVDRTAAGARKGRGAYMAPEQLDPSRGPITAAADQFGLGVMLGELMGDALAPDLGPIAARATANQPRDRYPSIDALRAALAAIQHTRSPAGPDDLARWLLDT